MTAAGWIALVAAYTGGAAVLTVSDLRRGLLPNRTIVVWAAAVTAAAIFAAPSGGPDGWVAPTVAGGVAWLLFRGLWQIRAVGGGDVKAVPIPAAVSALAAGWVGLGLATVSLGIACVAVTAVIMGLRARRGRLPREIPFGPMLFVAALWPLWSANPWWA